MSNKRNKTNIRDERIEDVTLYGEFIPSFDQWTSSERQRERARYLQEITNELAPGEKMNLESQGEQGEENSGPEEQRARQNETRGKKDGKEQQNKGDKA